MLNCTCKSFAINIMPELKRNILNFGYGVNFKYKGMLSHSFDRFYVVTNVELPKIRDFKLTTFSFDLTCKYLYPINKYMRKYMKHCERIVLHVQFYQKQIEYYNQTAYKLLKDEIGSILPIYHTNKRSNRGILTTALGSIASGVIGLVLNTILFTN